MAGDPYREIVNRSTDYITLINRDYVYEIANDAYCRQMGKKREEVVGRTVAAVWGDERFSTSIKPYLDRCFTGQQVNYVDKFTFGAVERHIQVSFFPYTSGGETTHALVFSHDISRLSKVEDRLTNYEVRDPTTGLFNRRSMEIIVDKELEKARDSRLSGHRAFLFVSVENLDRVINLYGHTTGDLILENTGLRILSCVRSSDYVFRFEGNELVVLISSIRDHVELATTAVQIHDEITVPYYYSGSTIALGASIGISIFPDDAQNREELIRNAHLAMSDAKARKAPYVFFDPQTHSRAQERLVLGAELANALNTRQFELFYQPIVDVKGHVVGAEALLRWHHSTRGMVSPAQIIPVAVDTGIIVSIGRWVLFTACEQIKRWSASRNLFVTINLSAGEFLDQHLLENVDRAIARSGIAANQLKLEITESDALADSQAAVERIRALQRKGIDVLIDDFGTGQSSLSYLRNLPARVLKLDQEFSADLEELGAGANFLAHIVQAIKSLSKLVLLEGVRTKAQAQNGIRLKVDLLQGELFGHAMSAERFEKILARRDASQARSA